MRKILDQMSGKKTDTKNAKNSKEKIINIPDKNYSSSEKFVLTKANNGRLR